MPTALHGTSAAIVGLVCAHLVRSNTLPNAQCPFLVHQTQYFLSALEHGQKLTQEQMAKPLESHLMSLLSH